MVLHVDKERAEAWTDLEVAERWLQLYSAPMLVARWLKEPASLGKPELDVVQGIISKWRARLHDISWFIKCIPALCPAGRLKSRSKIFPIFLYALCK